MTLGTTNEEWEYGIGLVNEESGEIVQEVGKALRFGLNTPSPIDGKYNGSTPLDRFRAECADMEAALIYGGEIGLLNIFSPEHKARVQEKLSRHRDPDFRSLKSPRPHMDAVPYTPAPKPVEPMKPLDGENDPRLLVAQWMSRTPLDADTKDALNRLLKMAGMTGGLKLHLIVMKGPDGTFQHANASVDEADTLKHFELLKQTRSAEAIPIMERYAVELAAPLDSHVKEPK